MNSILTLLSTFTISKGVVLSAFGGIVAYTLRYLEEKKEVDDAKFDFSIAFIHVILGIFVGYNVSLVVPNEFEFRDIVISFTGFVSYPILRLFENVFVMKMIKYIHEKF